MDRLHQVCWGALEARAGLRSRNSEILSNWPKHQMAMKHIGIRDFGNRVHAEAALASGVGHCPNAARVLETKQAAWNNSRDRKCKVEGGSMAGMARLCVVWANEQRISALEESHHAPLSIAVAFREDMSTRDCSEQLTARWCLTLALRRWPRLLQRGTTRTLASKTSAANMPRPDESPRRCFNALSAWRLG